MKIHSLVICLAAGICILAQPASASQKSDLENQGLKKMSGKDVSAMQIGRTCRGVSFDVKGKKKTSFKNTYRKNGSVTKAVTRVGESVDKRERKWSMNGNKFCETLYKSNKRWCDHAKVFHRVKNDAYIFHKNGAVQVKFACK